MNAHLHRLEAKIDATFAKFDHLAQMEAKTIVESQGNLADLPLDQMNTHSSFGSSIDEFHEV